MEEENNNNNSVVVVHDLDQDVIFVVESTQQLMDSSPEISIAATEYSNEGVAVDEARDEDFAIEVTGEFLDESTEDGTTSQPPPPPPTPESEIDDVESPPEFERDLERTERIFNWSRNRNMSDYNFRLKSFFGWPKQISQTPERLAAAGFFYTLFGSRVLT